MCQGQTRASITINTLYWIARAHLVLQVGLLGWVLFTVATFSDHSLPELSHNGMTLAEENRPGPHRTSNLKFKNMESDSSDDGELRRGRLALRRKERMLSGSKNAPVHNNANEAVSVDKFLTPTITPFHSRPGTASPIVLSQTTPIASARETNSSLGTKSSFYLNSVPRILADNGGGGRYINQIAPIFGRSGYPKNECSPPVDCDTGPYQNSSKNYRDSVKTANPKVPPLHIERISHFSPSEDCKNEGTHAVQKHAPALERRAIAPSDLDSDSDEDYSKTKHTGSFNRSSNSDHTRSRSRLEAKANSKIRATGSAYHNDSASEGKPNKARDASLSHHDSESRPPAVLGRTRRTPNSQLFDSDSDPATPKAPAAHKARQPSVNPGSRQASDTDNDRILALSQQVSALSAEVRSLKAQLRQQQTAMDAFRREIRQEVLAVSGTTPAAPAGSDRVPFGAKRR